MTSSLGDPAPVVFERVDPAGAEARWCLEQYYAEIDVRFEEGFDEALAIPIERSTLVPPEGSFLIARLEGAPVACGALTRMGPAVGYIKRMWVDGSVRGRGLGRRLLSALETEAASFGMSVVRLETNRALAEAIELYRSAGYLEVPAFNDELYAHHWFEKRLG